MRKVVFHHHLFKNAGTSVDSALRTAYGARWAQLEAERGELSGGELVAFLHRNPEVIAVSSHTYRFPLPPISGIRFLPLVFLRHPLDRARSAYEFERRQDVDTEGARLAKRLDFAGYVAARLARAGDRSFANFQTMKLSEVRAPADGSPLDEFLSALDTVCALPFVGLVENFAHSMNVFGRIVSLATEGIEFGVGEENVTRGSGRTLSDRVAEAEDELGPGLTQDFHAANSFDGRLHSVVRRLHYGMGAV